MSEQDRSNVIVFQPQSAIQVPDKPFETRARGFKISAPVKNFLQYVRTVKAYVAARMPFDHIQNAAVELSDPVERAEFDALVKEGWQRKQAEIAEGEGEFLAWQNRGEVVPSIGEIVLVSRQLTEVNPAKGNLHVLEGVAVVKQGIAELPQANHDAELENSPFLKKAA